MKTTYLFDFDGTLVDSSPLHEWAFREVLTAELPEALASFHYERVRGRATHEVFFEAGVTDPAECQRLTSLKQRRYQQAVRDGRLKVLPGADEVLSALSKAGRRLYLVTSGGRGSVELALDSTGLARHFRGIVTASDVDRGKPAPDLYLEALRLFGLNQEDCLAVEDAPSGVEAARAAGLDVVTVDPLASTDAWHALMSGVTPLSKTWAIIPAAGRGSRLGLDGPKILAPVDEASGETIWSIMAAKLTPFVDRIQLVLSPSGAACFKADRAARVNQGFAGSMPVPAFEACFGVRESSQRRNEPSAKGLWRERSLTVRGVDFEVAIQDEPLGMGDAVFRGISSWDADRILVVWGDQVNLSSETFERTLRAHAEASQPAFALPRVWNSSPYVQYDFNEQGGVTGVRQSREGDMMDAAGWSDAGLFCLSTAGLTQLWQEYLATAARGSTTGEINFLPFLPYLASRGWTTATLDVQDPDEARGVNTPADLNFARRRWRRECPASGETAS